MQTSYTQDMDPAHEGMIADTCNVQDIVTCFMPNAPAPFGALVVKADGGDDLVKLPGTTGDLTNTDKIRGVIVATQEQVSAYSYADPQLAASYVPTLPLPVMRKGRVWVRVEDQVTAFESKPHVRFNGQGKIGGFRATDDGSNTAPFDGAKFVTSTQGENQLAILEIDL